MEDVLQVFAKALRAVDGQLEARHIGGDEERKALDVIPVRMSDEKMQFAHLAGHHLDSKITDPAARVEDDQLVTHAEGQTRRAP